MKPVVLPMSLSMSHSQNEQILQTFRNEKTRLFNFIRKRVSSEEDAKDILQDVMYELVSTHRLMKPVEQIAAWLFTVARNKITDLYRKKKPDLLENLAEANGMYDDAEFFLTDVLTSNSDNADAGLMRNALLEAIQEAMEELPAEQKQVFVMHELEDLSFNEISELTGVGINTLLSRKRYAVLYLRKKLKAFYDELNSI